MVVAFDEFVPVLGGFDAIEAGDEEVVLEAGFVVAVVPVSKEGVEFFQNVGRSFGAGIVFVVLWAVVGHGEREGGR